MKKVRERFMNEKFVEKNLIGILIHWYIDKWLIVPHYFVNIKTNHFFE
jgi:hypothetical protein